VTTRIQRIRVDVDKSKMPPEMEADTD
jgi:hypothetical protein